MILFFDLDGPLLDVSRRYIVLHNDLMREHGCAPMPAERYWECKRAVRSEEAILGELGMAAIAPVYQPRRLALIESAAYLCHDRCWPWSHLCLQQLKQHATLVMVTARADRAALLRQLDDLRLSAYFDAILSEAGGERVDLQKAALMSDYLERGRWSREGHWMIGDTEADVRAGKRLGFRTVGVLSGIRDEARLTAAEPDFLLPDIRDLPPLLNLPPFSQEKLSARAACS